MERRPTLRFRGAIVLAWLAAAAALLPLARHVEDRLEVSARILGSESAETERILDERFESPFARSAILVLSGVPSPEAPEGRAVLDRVVEALAARAEVTGTFSYRDQADATFLGEGGRGTFVVVGLEAPDGRVDRLLPALRQATTELQEGLRAAHAAATLRWTGQAALNFDLWRSSADDTRRAERRTLPLTLAFLLFAFGSLGAALLTAASGALSVGLALGLVALAADHWPLSILAVNVASMIGLAVGIDYALLTVSRFREASAAGAPPEEAAAQAARPGGTVALSGLTVAIGFLALLLVPLNELRSAVLGGLLVALVSVLMAATLLPVALAWLGPWLEMDGYGRHGRTGAPGGGPGAGRSASGRGPSCSSPAFPCSSPLGVSASSTPTKAKTSRSTASPSSPAAGIPGHARCSGRTARSPRATRATSGRSFRAVAASTACTPVRTPRTLTSASRPTRETTKATRPGPRPSAGTRTATDDARAAAMPEPANRSDSQSRTPARNPASGPRPRST